MTFVEEIVDIVLETFTSFLASIGTGIIDLFDSLVLVKDESGNVTGLTALATWFLVFGAIGMAWGIVMVLFRKLRRGWVLNKGSYWKFSNSLSKMKGDNNMKIDITINTKAIEEIKRLAQYRLFKLKTDSKFNNRLHYSPRFIECEEEVLGELLEMLCNLERDKELILWENYIIFLLDW